MSALSKANFEAISDSLGIAFANLLLLDATTEATDLKAATAANLARVNALTDIAAQIMLLETFYNVDNMAVSPHLPANTLFANAVLRLQTNTGAFSTWMPANGVYVSDDFAALCAAIGVAVPVSQIMPPAVVSLATFAITGSGTGTFGAAGTIDGNVLAATNCEVEVTTDLGANPATFHLTMVKQNGSTEVKDVTLLATAVVGNKADIGLTADKYIDCSAITVAAGSDSGAIKVQNKLIRTPTA